MSISSIHVFRNECSFCFKVLSLLHTGKRSKKKPPPKEKKELVEKIDYRATATDDAIRNIDVILQTHKLNNRGVAAWLINHPACPIAFKEKCLSKEGK